MTVTENGWTKADVGCHWSRGGVNVSTYISGNNNERGYVIVVGRREVHRCQTWDQVEEFCERRKKSGLVGDTH